MRGILCLPVGNCWNTLVIWADRGAVYLMLPFSRKIHECADLLFVTTSLELTYDRRFYLHDSLDDVCRFITLASFQLAIMTAVQFFYDFDGATAEYSFGSLDIDQAGGGILFRLPPCLVDILLNFGFSRLPSEWEWSWCFWPWRFIEQRRSIGPYQVDRLILC